MKISRLAASLASKLSLALAAFASSTGPALAQSAWPNKPVRLIVAYPAGGLADVLIRHLQQPLTEALGQPLVIENRGGVNGNLAAEAMSRRVGWAHLPRRTDRCRIDQSLH